MPKVDLDEIKLEQSVSRRDLNLMIKELELHRAIRNSVTQGQERELREKLEAMEQGE